ncbi:MAG TPA: serine hydrolase [Gaiellaceae bacterium]|nr:serine hydrolase [Gaiellaceae bacterium]
MSWRFWAVFWAVFAIALLAAGCGSSRSNDGLRGITSVLVARHGKIVEERYYSGTHARDRLPVSSVTKSVTSALVGIAIADGKLELGERLPWRPQSRCGSSSR